MNITSCRSLLHCRPAFMCACACRRRRLKNMRWRERPRPRSVCSCAPLCWALHARLEWFGQRWEKREIRVSRCVAGILGFLFGTLVPLVLALTLCVFRISYFIFHCAIVLLDNGLFSLQIFQLEAHSYSQHTNASHMPIIIVLEIKITIIVRAKFEFEMHIIS